MTYHIGQGANLAIEDAAALSDVLRLYIAESSRDPGLTRKATLERRLAHFETVRLRRVKIFHWISRFAVRFLSSDGWSRKYFARYLLPYMCSVLCTILSKSTSKTVSPRPVPISWFVLCVFLAIMFALVFVAY